jgi:hypothetical protein
MPNQSPPTVEDVEAQVQALGDAHVSGPGRRGHTGEPVPGCPWCVDDGRAGAAELAVLALNPDVWHDLSAHTARFAVAAADLYTER